MVGGGITITHHAAVWVVLPLYHSITMPPGQWPCTMHYYRIEQYHKLTTSPHTSPHVSDQMDVEDSRS